MPVGRDDPLPLLGELVLAASGLDAADAHDAGAYVTGIELDLPLELALESDERTGLVRALRASPPTQQVRTTVMPVFHRLRVRVVAEGEEVDDWPAEPPAVAPEVTPEVTR